MFEELRKISTDKKDIKKFSVLFFGVFILFSIIFFYVGLYNYLIIFISLGLLFPIIGYLFPLALKPIYLIWMSFAVILGWIMSRIILIILFILVVLPTAIIAKLFRKKFVSSIDMGADTYWEKINIQKKSIDYEKQF